MASLKEIKSPDRVYPEHTENHRSHENGLFGEAPSYQTLTEHTLLYANKLSST